MRTVTGSFHHSELAAAYFTMYKFSYLLWSNEVFGTLHDQRWKVNLLEVCTVVRKKVTSANLLAIYGSVEQKLSVSSPANSGFSGFFMMAGARKFAQPI